MKIALNIERVGASRGGAEKYAASLARMLMAAGHEVHLFARSVDREELTSGARIHLVRMPNLPGFGVLRPYWFGRESERAIRPAGMDLVVGFMNTWYQDVYLAVGGTRPGTIDYSSRRFRSLPARAIFRACKAASPKDWLYRAIARRQFSSQYLPYVIAPSKIVAEHFQHYHNVPAERIAVIHNALDEQAAAIEPGMREAFRARAGLAADERAILFVARNYALKGLEPLLTAMKTVAERCPRARLVVCGSNRDRSYRRQAERLGIADRVRFLGSVDDIRPCFAGCDLFAFPTFYDTCSLVVLEAMDAGLPVVTTRQNGASELLTDGTDAFVIDSPWSTEQMADRLLRLLGDAALRTRIAERGRETVQRHGLQRRMSDLMDVFYRAAAERKSSQSGLGIGRAA